jgi:hypothetical protein
LGTNLGSLFCDTSGLLTKEHCSSRALLEDTLELSDKTWGGEWEALHEKGMKLANDWSEIRAVNEGNELEDTAAVAAAALIEESEAWAWGYWCAVSVFTSEGSETGASDVEK